jgi:oxygen-independent coproporphyrinogen III oxidase
MSFALMIQPYNQSTADSTPSLALLDKYNVSVPRYTSYPTVPFWHDNIDIYRWTTNFKEQFTKLNKKEGISLYLHLPFCESLCTYCGCNKKITTNHSVEYVYLDAILKEWKMYLALVDEKPLIRELHLGGGTPTFFTPGNLSRLVTEILSACDIHPNYDFSIEGHPNNTTEEHLQALYNLGFRRISYGVQENDPKIQKAINRIQPFETVRKMTMKARIIGFKSVNFDLIYGLPFQTVETITKTIKECISVKPDRVAFYSYAHVPWKSRMQRLFDEGNLPDAQQKLELYQTGKKLFLENGYTDIGMDHFALTHDELYIAKLEHRLHRNFMGYTTQQTHMLIGLGMSAISDTGNSFAQNDKNLLTYYQMLEKNQLPITKGYFLNDVEVAFKKYILDISCNGKTFFDRKYHALLHRYTFPELKKLEADKLIVWNEDGLHVTKLGTNFIRNICSAFDLHLLRDRLTDAKPVYSKAI